MIILPLSTRSHPNSSNSRSQNMISAQGEESVILIQARAPATMDGPGSTVGLLHMHSVRQMLCLELAFRQLEQGMLMSPCIS